MKKHEKIPTNNKGILGTLSRLNNFRRFNFKGQYNRHTYTLEMRNASMYS